MSAPTLARPVSAFPSYERKAWPYQFAGQIHIDVIAGGVPTDPKVAEGWIKSNLLSTGDLLRAQVAEVMADRGVTADEAAKVVDEMKHLNGFRRVRCPACPADDPRARCDSPHELYINGHQLKAAIKEAASVAVAADKLPMKGWGKTNKNLLGFVAEHVCVIEDVLPLGVTQPTGINQRFVQTWRGSGIQYEEYVEGAIIDFTIATDFDFKPEHWAMIWLTGGQQGIGATRSQGYGRYTVTRWEALP